MKFCWRSSPCRFGLMVYFYFVIFSLSWNCQICTYYQHYTVMCVYFFSLSQYEIIIFYVLILWTASAGAKKCHSKKKKRKKPLNYHCNVASAWVFLFVSLAKRRARLHWEDQGSFIFKNCAIKAVVWKNKEFDCHHAAIYFSCCTISDTLAAGTFKIYKWHGGRG